MRTVGARAEPDSPRGAGGAEREGREAGGGRGGGAGRRLEAVRVRVRGGGVWPEPRRRAGRASRRGS